MGIINAKSFQFDFARRNALQRELAREGYSSAERALIEHSICYDNTAWMEVHDFCFLCNEPLTIPCVFGLARRPRGRASPRSALKSGCTQNVLKDWRGACFGMQMNFSPGTGSLLQQPLSNGRRSTSHEHDSRSKGKIAIAELAL
jgi:hypothetical protein